MCNCVHCWLNGSCVCFFWMNILMFVRAGWHNQRISFFYEFIKVVLFQIDAWWSSTSYLMVIWWSSSICKDDDDQHHICKDDDNDHQFSKMMMTMIVIFANCKSVDWFPIIVARAGALKLRSRKIALFQQWRH